MRTSNNDPMKLYLWPHLLKYVGFTIAIAGLMTFFLTLFGAIPKPLFKSYYEFFWPVIAAGLFIAAMSKEKKEDELMLAMRFRACFAGFMFGALWSLNGIIVSFIPFFSDYFPQFDGAQLMTVALGFYHGMFRTMKRRAKK